jgi:hypothetical protein
LTLTACIKISVVETRGKVLVVVENIKLSDAEGKYTGQTRAIELCKAILNIP